MELSGAVAVVTGAASGIGRALAEALALQAGAVVVAADIDAEGAAAVASQISRQTRPAACKSFAVDVTDEAGVSTLIAEVEAEIGPIELWCANAGIAYSGGVELPDESWERIWQVNLMAHVFACRQLLPRWLDRGSGHLLVTASAAGLLTSLGNASYAVTKHAAVALAEWVAITHGDAGVRVSCLCPQGVRTAMTERDEELGVTQVEALGMIEPEQVASAAIEALREDRFLILPHPEVASYEQRRSSDRERWLRGMRKMQRTLTDHPSR